MKFFRFSARIFIFLLLTQPILAFGKKDKTDSEPKKEQTEEIKKDFLKIDLFLDTKNPNQKNHFYWQTSSVSYKDSFDALSGASKVHSTQNLRESTLDKTTKSLQIPKGLYALCLFAIASPDSLQKDDFQIENEGKKLTITFSHRGNEYKIESDENGIIKVPDGFFIKKMQKNESEEQVLSEFVADSVSEKASAFYTGKLKSKLDKNRILEITGKLRLTKQEIPPSEAKESESEDEKSPSNP